MKRTLSLQDIIRFAAALLAGTMTILAQPAAPSVGSWDPYFLFRTHKPRWESDEDGGAPTPASTSQRAQSGASQTSTAASFSGTPYAVGGTRTPTTTTPQAEEHITVDPNNPNTLVAAISDFSLPRVVAGVTHHYNTTKYALTWDSGNSWSDAFVPLDANGWLATGDGHSWQANSDPVVAIDKSGYVYLAGLYFDTTDSADGLYVSVTSLADLSTGGGFTAARTLPVVADYDPANSNIEDKPWLAVDNSASPYSGNVYVAWLHSSASTYAIWFSRSTDHGASWATPVVVAPATSSAQQGAQVAVGPDGTVYVVWQAYNVNSYGQSQHCLAKSLDGGQSFSKPAAITPAFNLLTFASPYRKWSWPALAVDPLNGYLYVAYADQPNSTVGAQVEFIASFNGGAIFSAPVAINDNASGQQFMPALAVDGQGTVHCSWFDTRNSPTGQADYYDLYATYSANGGTTFAPNTRVTSTPIAAATFIGDYAGLAAAAGYAHPVWTSGGLQTGTLLLPSVQSLDFGLSATPSSAVIVPASGGTTTYAVAVSSIGGFADTVDLSIGGLPTGTSATFSPNPTGGSSTLTVTVANGTAAGAYPLTITGTASHNTALSHTVGVNLVVAANPSVARVASISYAISGGKNLVITLALRNDFNQPVAGASVERTWVW